MQVATLRANYAALVMVFTERSRRVWAAREAKAIGYGGIALVARATGIVESIIQRGLRDLRVRLAPPLVFSAFKGVEFSLWTSPFPGKRRHHSAA